MSSKLTKEKRWDLLIGLSGVVIGSLIALVPTWLTRSASERTKFEERKLAVINRRIELIDKTSQVFYKLPGIEELMNYGVTSNLTFTPNLAGGNINRIPKDITVSKEMALARSEFFSLIIQDQLYFGPKTKQAIEKMFKDKDKSKSLWWMIPEEAYGEVLKQMVSELNYE